MLKTVAIAFFSAMLGAATVYALIAIAPRDTATAVLLPSADEDSRMEQRIASLEQQLLNEIELLAELEQQIEGMSVLGGGSSMLATIAASGEDAVEGGEAEAPVETEEQRRARIREERRARNSVEGRIARLERNGFASEQARQIIQREEQIQTEQIQARWQRRRDNFLKDQAEGIDDSINLLRNELGDEQYERYLKATGRSTAVNVSRVMDVSAAANSGILAGDQILRYNGARVFNLSDLNNQTIRGEAGEMVTIDIERNGNELQLTIPRGPLGITSRRQRR